MGINFEKMLESNLMQERNSTEDLKLNLREK